MCDTKLTQSDSVGVIVFCVGQLYTHQGQLYTVDRPLSDLRVCNNFTKVINMYWINIPDSQCPYIYNMSLKQVHNCNLFC